MPWCETCSRYWTPSSLRPGGECPACGSTVREVAEHAAPPVPWHFKLLLVALVLYLGYRAVQGVVWLAHHL